MSYYRTCPHCGAHLDPGERCDCREALESEAMRLFEMLTESERQEIWEEIKNIPASAANTDGDGVDQIETTDSTCYDTGKGENLQA